MIPASPHLRPRDGGEQPTTTMELFFDLVYVFAVTQLSHLVLNANLSLAAVGRTGFLLLVVWWAWIYTTWMANWFDPRSGAVRLVLVGVSLASLLMSTAIPDAFAGQGLLFAGAYVALQVGRNAAGTLLLSREHALRRTIERLVVWSVASGVLWLASATVASSARFALWGPALAVDLAAPLVGYWTPRLGRSETNDYPVESAHFAERFQSFIIIALGESIVVTGGTASARGLSTQVALGPDGRLPGHGCAVVAVLRRGGRALAPPNGGVRGPRRLARDAYSYLHLPIVAGIIMVAIADELLIAHPGRVMSRPGWR